MHLRRFRCVINKLSERFRAAYRKICVAINEGFIEGKRVKYVLIKLITEEIIVLLKLNLERFR